MIAVAANLTAAALLVDNNTSRSAVVGCRAIVQNCFAGMDLTTPKCVARGI
jgi:hypothetical protein